MLCPVCNQEGQPITCIAGASSALVVGYLLTWTNQNWTLAFYLSAAIYGLGAVCWLFLDSHTPLEPATVP
jgi:hypothetical protein